MAVKVIYFVHGTTTDNAEHKSTGWIPGELTEKGIQQSIDLKNQINLEEIDLVISSDLNGEDTSLVVYEDHITEPFPNGESLKDVENRVRDFCDYLLENFDGKTVAIVAHKAPQLAFEVITKEITWEEAIEKDWRKIKAWQPGWEYIIK